MEIGKKRKRSASPDIAENSASASSSASASNSGWNYEVFLSFMGKEIRQGLADYLYQDLEYAGIRTFRDSESLHIGQEIGPELIKAIKESKIFIPIFSSEYASSEWCLRELAQSVECQSITGQKIFPIFYYVDPFHVRHQTGSFDMAFVQHNGQYDEKTVNRWKEALTKAGELKGWEFEKETRYRGRLVKMVVLKVLLELTTSNMVVTDDFVGVDHLREEMERYEVVLCSGKDTRFGFTDYLYNDLVDAGIRTFINDDENVGLDIGPEILKAIKESKIFIPIFSKSYASSKWCLLGLAQMVEYNSPRQRILPIFYDVEPCDVHLMKSYYDTFYLDPTRYDRRFVQEWCEALREVGQMKGWELTKETNGYQGTLVKMVVSYVLLDLKNDYMVAADNLVGIDHHVEEMRELLNLDSNDIWIVGIHGVGGIGKTTIANLIYDQLSKSFECCCFLADVKEMSEQHNGFINLQNELISKILRGKCLEIINVDEGINMIKDTVFGKKILIVLDDVDKKSQIDILVGNCEWFGLGSRIIVTTRDKEVLNLLKVDRTYEPLIMGFLESLQLFSKHAFRRDSPPKDYNILSEKVVLTAAGIPLALEVIGSFFYGKGKALWEHMLMKLEKIPNVQERLRISYEALNFKQKQIFLDIACPDIGVDKRPAFYTWDDYKFNPTNEINVLVLRSLVKIGHDNKLIMHDQLRDLGRQIVHEECFKRPAKRSRLWFHDEDLDMSARQMVFYWHGIVEVEAGRVDIFKLETLNLYSINVSTLPAEIDALSQLKQLKLEFCHRLRYIPRLPSSLFKLYLNYSVLERLPDLSQLKNLSTLELINCFELTEIQGLENLESLRHLNTSWCEFLGRLPDLSKLKKLQKVVINGCKRLHGIQGLESVAYLKMNGCTTIRGPLDPSNLGMSKELTFSESQKDDQGLQSVGTAGKTSEYLSTSFASAFTSGGKYEVFLSFRGEDTYYFTDYLYNDLVYAGIRTFRDINELHSGEQISPELQKVIKESKISIPIFSKEYASGEWCLFELAQMLECLRTTGLKIFPIFYDVEPSDVQHQTGSYEEAFFHHKRNFDEKTVQGWKEALGEVGNMKGWVLRKETDGYQGKLVKMVVSKVLLELTKSYMVVTDNLVGIDRHVEEVMKLLDVDSNDVLTVGIHGIGGIGKTTIAKVIYNQLLEDFECCSFLVDIRETSQHGGLVNLQNELISELRKDKFLVITDVHEGINMIKDTVSSKKVLIVLDDVDEKSQVDKFVGDRKWFGSGSRIIVTANDKEVLNMLEVDRTYQPPLMKIDHSIQLFSKHAFRRDFPPEDYINLSRTIVSTIEGLPLALEILGSFLFGKEKEIWEETLERLEDLHNEPIHLKLPYLKDL